MLAHKFVLDGLLELKAQFDAAVAAESFASLSASHKAGILAGKADVDAEVALLALEVTAFAAK